MNGVRLMGNLKVRKIDNGVGVILPKEFGLQPGDILVVYESGGSHHVEIYAGNGRSYSCGSNSSIRADTISTNFSKYNFALRVTGRGGN